VTSKGNVLSFALLFFAARFAEAGNGEVVKIRLKAQVLFKVRCERAGGLQIYEGYCPTVLAYEIKMRVVAVEQLETMLTVARIDAGDHIEILQQIQRAVNGGDVDGSAVPANVGGDFLCRGIFLDLVHHRKDDLPLWCEAEPAFAELFHEGFFTGHK
jgi:hypothetical protein